MSISSTTLKMLAEDRDAVRTQAVKKIFELGIDKVCRDARSYGTVTTRRFIDQFWRNGPPCDSAATNFLARHSEACSRQADAHTQIAGTNAVDTHAHAKRSDTHLRKHDVRSGPSDAQTHAHAQRSIARSQGPDVHYRQSDAHSKQSSVHAWLSDELATGVSNALPSPETNNIPAENDKAPANSPGAS